jgi:putative ABC transport system permease protein
VFLSIPWWQLGLGLVLAALAGIVAAVFPAWRASKLDLLTAISYE